MALSWSQQALQSLVQDLRMPTNPTTAGLLSCGQKYLDGLLAAADHLLRGEQLEKSLRSTLDCFVNQSHAKMASSSGNPAIGWRRLYTDACILQAFADIRSFISTGDESLAISSISSLDHAIIIAGAAGTGRLDLILDLIEKVQSECLERHEFAGTSDAFQISPSKNIVPPPPLHTFTKKVPCIDQSPSLAAFQSRLSKRPFVLPGYILDWPALTEHPWRDLNYLRSAAGPGRVIPVEVGGDYRSDDWTQEIMPWDTFLDVLSQPLTSGSSKSRILYLAQHDLFTQFPALRADIILPDYVYASMSPPENMPQYSPPTNEDQLVLNAWLGPAGAVSPAHTDPYFNFYGDSNLHRSRRDTDLLTAQVVGRKTVWLAPPDATLSMYPYSSQSGTATPHNPAANNTNVSMSNTSRVDVFCDSPKNGTNSRSSGKMPYRRLCVSHWNQEICYIFLRDGGMRCTARRRAFLFRCGFDFSELGGSVDAKV
ncbi:Lysine-specific demethylase 8, partial [Grifola frondosa]